MAPADNSVLPALDLLDAKTVVSGRYAFWCHDALFVFAVSAACNPQSVLIFTVHRMRYIYWAASGNDVSNLV